MVTRKAWDDLVRSESSKASGHRVPSRNEQRLLRDLPPPPLTVMEHRLSTFALCLSMLTVSYSIISVFPYSGFMSIQLLPNVLNTDNAGLCSGLISSAYLAGRGFSGYVWGQAADAYGRVTCLSFSLLLTSLLSLAFGLSTNIWIALFWRFCLGIVNHIPTVVKKAVTEQTGNDKNLETRTMRIVIGMRGWGFLLIPIVSGLVSEPLRQYTRFAGVMKDDATLRYLELIKKFPFFLPNLLGAAIGMISMVAVNLFVIETVPIQKRRHIKNFPSDIWSSIKRNLSIIPEGENEESTPLLRRSIKQIQYKFCTKSPEETEQEREQQAIHYWINEDVKGAVDEAMANYEESALILFTSPNPKQLITDAEIMFTPETSQRQRASLLSDERSFLTPAPPPATVSTLWAQPKVRNHLILYWGGTFLFVAIDEIFPLFCISASAGMGLMELSIGAILSASGLIYAIAQYGAYESIVQKFGLFGSMKLSSILLTPILVAIPLALWTEKIVHYLGGRDPMVALFKFAFLSIAMAFFRIVGLVYLASLTISMNQTVYTCHRGLLNDVAIVGGRVVRS